MGILYNKLERSDQIELLRHMIERVVVNPEGKIIRLELLPPPSHTCAMLLSGSRVEGKVVNQQRGKQKPAGWLVNVRITSNLVDLRGIVSKTRHMLDFQIPLPPSTLTNQLNPDKTSLRERIFTLRAEGKSYREIAAVVNIHFTRVRQILKEL